MTTAPAHVETGAAAQNCTTCIFYVPFGDASPDAGQCRRFPPAVIVLPVPAPPQMLNAPRVAPSVSPAAAFPLVQASRTWCGEYDDGGDDEPGD